jgi:hypothetical protein
MGLSEAAIREIMRNAFLHAFLPDGEAERLVSEFDVL